MNMLVDGEWRTDAYEATNDDGEFERQTTSFRDSVSEDGAFPAEPNRYHLYIARACPWAHGAAMVRSLKGLEDVISMSVVEPVRINDGWEFNAEYSDPLYDAAYLRDIYTRADGSFTGRVTVPVLWDTKTETIVNNESIEIMRMLDTAFDEYGNGVRLYPDAHQDEIDRVVDEVYEPINNGVYRAGFADTQDAYETAVDELFDALDHWDAVLGEQRFLVGDQLTLADLRLFATLVRFDNVYHTHFKCNRKMIQEYENLWGFTRDVYQIPAVRKTVKMGQIKDHYYRSHTSLNPKQLVGVGPDLAFDAGHRRDMLRGDLHEAISSVLDE